MSSLPTVDDLQNKARSLDPSHVLDLRSLSERYGPPLITHESVIQEQEESATCAAKLLRKFNTFFKSTRHKLDLPAYKPLQKQLSSNSSSSISSTTLLSPSKDKFFQRYNNCVLPAILSVLAFWTGLIIWNVISTWSSRMHLSTTSSSNLEKQWYTDATFYEIFPASFMDTDSDGYGDFQGIILKLDYIRDLGVSAIRLNSIFSALDYPLEYEHVIDLHSADPHLGKADDFRRLIKEAHRRELKVVLDLNPTITSDQHTWALHWQRGIPGYEHFYASANRSKAPPEMENLEGPPPEDWELTQRTFGGHYVLNWSNPMVQEEYREALEHWIDAGVDGFYMKHIEKLHVLTPEDIPPIIHGWRKILDQPRSAWAADKTCRRVLITSSLFADHMASEFGHSSPWREVLQAIDILDCPILVGSGQEIADQVYGLRKVSSWPNGFPVPMWHLGSVDTFRLASRIEPRYQEAALFLLMTLPGTNSVFYGDEIGLRDSYDMTTGRVYRAGQLTPMQWTTGNATGGFTDNSTQPWLPLNPDHVTTNVQSRQNQLQQFKRMVDFRRTSLRGFEIGDQRVDVLDPNVLVLETSRHSRRSPTILLAANFGSVSEEKVFPDSYQQVRVLITTAEPTRTRVRTRSFTLSPGAAFLSEVSLTEHQHSQFVPRTG